MSVAAAPARRREIEAIAVIGFGHGVSHFFHLMILGPVEVGLVILAFLIAYLYMRLGIIKPVQRLTETTDKLSLGEEVAGVARNISKGSRNEIDQLRLAINRLRNSMQIAIHQRRGKGQKKDTGRIRDDQ